MNAQVIAACMRLLSVALVAALSGASAFSASGDATLTTVVTFNGTNGALPMVGLTLGNNGNLYGTTYEGGTNKDWNGVGCGTLFRVTPGGTLTTLVNFGEGGLHPGGNLVQGRDGNFYGTTLQGGELGDGAVFKMSADGKVTWLYSFGAYDEHGGVNTNGWAPITLVEGAGGNLFGITADYEFSGGGTIFKITPTGKLTTLLAFRGRETVRPSGTLLAGADGNFYGALTSGLLFRLTPIGKLTTTFSHDGANGTLAAAALIESKDGKFFGLTTGATNGGSVLRMDASGKFATLVRISGECPSGELIQATDGNFYGVNPLGGPRRAGAVFRLKTDGTMTTLFEFDGRNGNQPTSRLTQGKDGNLYGTTSGGMGTGGTVFRLTLNPK